MLQIIVKEGPTSNQVLLDGIHSKHLAAHGFLRIEVGMNYEFELAS